VDTHGFVLELNVDRTEATIGDRVFATVNITNQGTESPLWETNTCGTGPAPIDVTTSATVFGQGQTWDGNAALFKVQTLSSVGINDDEPSRIGRFVETPFLDAHNLACTADSRQRPFVPGQVVEDQLGWNVAAGKGLVIPTGLATLTATFTSEAGSVSASAPLTISGAAGSDLTLVDYIDAALAEPTFKAWLERHDPSDRMDPSVIYWPNEKGKFPRFEPYTHIDRPVVEVGSFYPEDFAEGSFGAVVLDLKTAEVLGTRFE
jgi:hypothetical protein